jgi:hypothetical protein
MRRVLRALALTAPLFAALPAAAQTNRCPDILLGDSLAAGMGPSAREMGFETIARVGAGITWLRDQPPRCANRLVLVFGTNDLRGLTPDAADAYVTQIKDVIRRWPARRVIWATPGCFARDPALERGSVTLDRAVSAAARQGGMPAIHRGRTARCAYPSADGVHPTGDGYRAWWDGIAPALRPPPAQRPAPNTLRRADANSGISRADIAALHPSAMPMRLSVPGSTGRP